MKIDDKRLEVKIIHFVILLVAIKFTNDAFQTEIYRESVFIEIVSGTFIHREIRIFFSFFFHILVFLHPKASL